MADHQPIDEAMRKRFAIALGGLALLHAAAAGAAEPKPKVEPPFFEMLPIGFPVVVKGELVNYVFVNLKLVLDPKQDAAKLHAREPFLRDLLVRDAARTPFNPPDSAVRLDDARLKAAVMTASRATFGPGVVVSVQITSETPQRRTGMGGR
jgi:hypothetical protein